MIESALPLEDYILFADKRKALGNLNKRMLFVLPFFLLLFAAFHYRAQGLVIPIRSKVPPYTVSFVRILPSPFETKFYEWLPWFFAAEFAVLYLAQVRSFRKQAKPIVALSSEGIAIDTQAAHLGLIYWNEIEEIRNYNFVYRYVGIIPKNSAALTQRLGKKRAWILSLNAAFIPLYKSLGIFIAPINIPQIYLPMSADELLTHIRAYQAAYSPNSNQIHPGLEPPAPEGVWPPPPRREN